MDRQLNISSAYLRPGFAFGGSCLPKDLKALLLPRQEQRHRAADAGNILPSNVAHIEHAIEQVLASGRRSIGMIGLSFKAGTDDLRESPLVIMAERFIGKGLQLSHLRSAGQRRAADRREPPLHRGEHSAHRLADDRRTSQSLVRDVGSAGGGDEDARSAGGAGSAHARGSVAARHRGSAGSDGAARGTTRACAGDGVISAQAEGQTVSSVVARSRGARAAC